MLESSYFNQDAISLAKSLLGKVIFSYCDDIWLAARIIETEAYYLHDKASHASLGYTEKRKALFMPAGTIYMYYARGADSFNISAKGEGNAVLIKAAYPYLDLPHADKMIKKMQQLNPQKNSSRVRTVNTLCKGQTLLCKALGITVKKWDQQQFEREKFYIADKNVPIAPIIQTKRLGIPLGRDENLPYRFIDSQFLPYCTKKPALIKE